MSGYPVIFLSKIMLFDACCGIGSQCRTTSNKHDDVIKWKQFPRYWLFVLGIHRSPVNSPHKGQWRGALIFSLICGWINGWVNNREAGDLRCHRAHYDVTVMTQRRWDAAQRWCTGVTSISTGEHCGIILISCEWIQNHSGCITDVAQWLNIASNIFNKY